MGDVARDQLLEVVVAAFDVEGQEAASVDEAGYPDLQVAKTSFSSWDVLAECVEIGEFFLNLD